MKCRYTQTVYNDLLIILSNIFLILRRTEMCNATLNKITSIEEKRSAKNNSGLSVV